jgi:hypothetical protein
LNAHVDDATIKATFISAKANRTPGDLADNLVIESSGALYKMLLSTLQSLLNPPGAPYSVYPGAVIQTVTATPYVANANLAVIPFDDTIPQITEGTQILTLNIAPRFTNSKIQLTFNGFGAADAAGAFSAALFRVGTTDALKVTTTYLAGANYRDELNIDWVDSPATTTTVTYTIRAGAQAGNIARMNGNSTARFFGGTAACTLVAKEIKA